MTGQLSALPFENVPLLLGPRVAVWEQSLVPGLLLMLTLITERRFWPCASGGIMKALYDAALHSAVKYTRIARYNKIVWLLFTLLCAAAVTTPIVLWLIFR